MGAKVRVLCTRRYCSTYSDETTVTALFSDTIWFQQTFQHLQGILVNADPPPLYADPLGPLPLTPKVPLLDHVAAPEMSVPDAPVLSSILPARRIAKRHFGGASATPESVHGTPDPTGSACSGTTDVLLILDGDTPCNCPWEQQAELTVHRRKRTLKEKAATSGRPAQIIIVIVQTSLKRIINRKTGLSQRVLASNFPVISSTSVG